MQAAMKRKSIAAIIREKLQASSSSTILGKKAILEQFEDLGKKIAKEQKGLNLTQGLLDMRAEQ